MRKNSKRRTDVKNTWRDWEEKAAKHVKIPQNGKVALPVYSFKGPTSYKINFNTSTMFSNNIMGV